MLVTVSRSSGKSERQFARDFANTFPNSLYVSRGKSSLKKLLEKARYLGKKILLVVGSKNGLFFLNCLRIKEDSFNYLFEAELELLKTRKDFNLFKGKASSLRISVKSEDLKKMLMLFCQSFERDADFLVKEENLVVSVFLGEKEIGPKFEVKRIGFHEQKTPEQSI